MAAILAAILDFGYLQKSKHLNNASDRFLIPQNICLDTLLVFLVCMVRKLWSKYENDGHFGRHLGFWKMPTRDFRGLFISDSTHIPGPILKKSACYQTCPPFGLYELILLGYYADMTEFRNTLHTVIMLHVTFSIIRGRLSADPSEKPPCKLFNYRLITAYLLLRVNLDKIMHARWDFDASSARTRRVSALNKHQNWSASALFCLNSRAQSKYAVVNLIHTRRKQTFCLLLCDK